MKLGIVGNGRIVQEVLQILTEHGYEIPALWCRNEEHGRPVVDTYHISSFYTDYDLFLKDTSFDTVYIGTVNSSHFELAKKALEAHKHVIVEKPFTSTYREAKELFDIAFENQVYLFEAVMSRYSRNYDMLLPHLDAIGDLKMIRADFSQYSSRYDAYCNKEVLPAFDLKCSGGALMDLNVYNVHFVTGIFGAPKFSYYMANKGYNGIDTSGVLIMDYGDFKAVCTAAKDSSAPCGTVLQGTEGYIFIHSRPGEVQNIILHDYRTGLEKKLDVQEEIPLLQEFERIGEVIDTKQDAVVMNWLNRSMQTMLVLENARQDAGITFPADDAE